MKASLRTRLCCLVLALYALVAAWAEVQHLRSAHRDETPVYNCVDLSSRNLPPLSRTASAARESEGRSVSFHLLGTDSLGRDVALRLAQGTRIAFHVGIVTSCIAIPLGAFLGLVAGYFRKGVDASFRLPVVKPDVEVPVIEIMLKD